MATRDGRPAGYCWAVGPAGFAEGFVVLLAVKRSARCAGVGSALLERAESFLAAKGCAHCSISNYPPAYFTPGVDEAEYVEGLRFLCRRGYRITSRPLAMELNLASFRPPAKVRLAESPAFCRDADPARTLELLRFAERFSADWARFVREAFRDIHRGDNPARLQIALVGGRIVGFSHFEGSRFGPIGVDPEHEGKGIGSALMARTLGAMRAQGANRAWFLWTDDRTAQRFYAPCGWREWRRFSILLKELPQ